jgi:hypothetical protein
MAMFSWFFWGCLALISLYPSTIMAQEKSKTDQEAVFPTEVSGWKWDGKENHYNRKTIFDYIDGAGELYIAYNFNGVKVRRYEKPGQPPMTAEIFDMATSEDAYGVFSFERQDDEAGIGQGSEFGGGLLRFWKGSYFVSVFGEGQGREVETATLQLGKRISDSIKNGGPLPRLLNALPNGKTGLAGKSIRYLHSHILLNQRFFISNQNILNLHSKTEAVLGQYTQGQQKSHLLVIRYADEKEAATALQKFKNGYMPAAGEKRTLQTEDKKWTTVEPHKEFLILVFGTASKEAGEVLVRGALERIKTL